MVILPLFSIALFSSVRFVAAALDAASVVAQLSSSQFGLLPETQIFLRSDPNWVNETTQRYTIHDAPSYIVSVKPAGEVDVQKIVKFASEFSIPFLATGGGHGFATTFEALQNGLEIDLGFFSNISIDAAASTMTIGGAVTIQHVIEPLFDVGKEIRPSCIFRSENVADLSLSETGSEKCVGMVGATLGGGVGRYNGLHGMMVDALLNVTMVTAAGDIINVSATENSDLFWGIRGAGFSYGIVLSATYAVYDLTNQGSVMNADFLFPLNMSTAVFQYFKSLESNQPAELALIFQTGFNAALGGVYTVVNAVYAGPLEQGTALLQPLLNAHPLQHNISMVPYKDLLSSAFFGSAPANAPCVKGENRNVYGAGIKTYDIPTFETFFKDLQQFYASYPNANTSVFFIEAFPTQAARAIADDATAYPHRDITAHLFVPPLSLLFFGRILKLTDPSSRLFNYGYTDPSLEGAVNAFAKEARSNFSATSGFDGLQVYVSYGHGDEGPVPLYGEAGLPRLRALKQKWDPKGLFSFNEPY